MCQAIKDMIEDGRQEGIKEGIKAFIELCQEIGMVRETTLAKVQEKFDLKDSAEKYLDEYWK